MIPLAEVFGFLFLWIPALLGAYTAPIYPSIKPGHGPVDRWSWEWVNTWYANIEDGNGLYAVLTDGTPYRDTFPKGTPDWVIVYAWSAWRNGANNIKRPLRHDTWAS